MIQGRTDFIDVGNGSLNLSQTIPYGLHSFVSRLLLQSQNDVDKIASDSFTGDDTHAIFIQHVDNLCNWPVEVRRGNERPEFTFETVVGFGNQVSRQQIDGVVGDGIVPRSYGDRFLQ